MQLAFLNNAKSYASFEQVKCGYLFIIEMRSNFLVDRFHLKSFVFMSRPEEHFCYGDWSQQDGDKISDVHVIHK